MRHRILVAILLPVVIVGVLLSGWATTALVPPLLGFIQNRTDAGLKLVTNLSLEKCEHSFNYLLDLRLDEDPSMNASLKRETLSEIKAVSDQFDKIQVIVLNAHYEAISNVAQAAASPAIAIENLNSSGTIVPASVFGRPARVSVLYFPFWRWHIVGFIFEKDYHAPITMARNIIIGGTFGLLLAVIITAGLAFYLRVNQPLKRIILAAKRVAVGQWAKVDPVGKDEIGQVTSAFNAMVEGLEVDQQKIKEIMSALAESEEMYRVITENSLSQITLVKDNKIIFANQRALEDSGYSLPEIVGRSALTHIYQRDRSAVNHMASRCLQGDPAPGPVECHYVTKSGELRWMELSVVPMTYKGQPVLLAHGLDITERKAAFEEQQRLESRLQQAQKLEAIGTLAGGIAHDFNNLLMGVQGNISLMMLDISADNPHHERLKNVRQYVKTAADLTQQLLGYARGGKYESKPLRLNDLVRQTARMFGRTKKEIVIQVDLQPNIWIVEADPSQIKQVLLNLYINAWQAMAGGGELHIKTQNVSLAQEAFKTFPEKAGEFVCITVTDTGVGMDEETLQKIFDPFFTTKQRERGTGLGLASAYGIVKNHGGGIFCQSKPKKGTIFFIYLPRSEKRPEVEAVDMDAPQAGSGTVLLVDDEEMVLNIGQEMLAYLGYQVLIAQSGQAAIEILEQQGDQIDIVILDMIMPGMGGAETFDALRQIQPHIPVLLCSGYSIEGQASRIMERGCEGFIQKPFELELLSQQLREILKNASSSR